MPKAAVKTEVLSVSQPAASSGALVIGGDYRALTIVRSLGRRGIPVWVLTDEQAIAASSRFARKRLPWPGRLAYPAQVDYLQMLARRYRLENWALIATADEHAALIAQFRDDLAPPFRVASSDWEVVRWAYDKRLSYLMAAEVGVDHPRTWYPRGADEVARIECEFPVILKPAIKADSNRFTEAKAWQVADRDQLLAGYRAAAGLLDPRLIMVQELVRGGGESQYSYGALCVGGEPLATVVARRRRQFPVDFGRSSSYVETVEEPAVESAARRMLAALRYTGLIEVEFKRDPRDGRMKLLDLNPRSWGWITLAELAGVDLPYLFFRLCCGESIAPIAAKSGVRWVRMTTDVPAALTEMWRGRLSLAAYVDSLRRPLQRAVLALDDPLPAMLEVPLLSIAKCRRWIRALRPSRAPARRT